MASEYIPEFMEKWNDCFKEAVKNALGGTSFAKFLDSIFTDDLTKALEGALGGEESVIVDLLFAEIQFLCDYEEGTGSGYPTPTYAKQEKLKVFLKSLIALLDTLDAKSKKLLHILIELLCLAQ